MDDGKDGLDEMEKSGASSSLSITYHTPGLLCVDKLQILYMYASKLKTLRW